MKQLENSPNDDLIDAYKKGLFTESELYAAIGPELGALVEKSPEIALRMVREFAGTLVWVPMTSTQPSQLRERLDESDTQVVVNIFSGCQLSVPTLRLVKSAVRRRQVAALRASGWKLSELARHFKVTERAIQMMLKRHRESEI